MTFRASIPFVCFALCLPMAPSYGQNACLATPQIFPATTLAQLAEFHYGTIDYQFAIMLATNARVGVRLSIYQRSVSAAPGDLPEAFRSSASPGFNEAETLRNRYDTYLRALADMALAVPAEVSHSLDPIDPASR